MAEAIMFAQELERAHLLQARSHIAATRARIGAQCLRIARSKARGIDTKRAEDSLRIMQETLRVMQAHKRLIEDMLVQWDSMARARAAARASVSRWGRGGDRATSQQKAAPVYPAPDDSDTANAPRVVAGA